jgi:hypothetical protein
MSELIAFLSAAGAVTPAVAIFIVAVLALAVVWMALRVVQTALRKKDAS